MLTEEDFITADVYMTYDGAKYYTLGSKDRETWKTYLLAFQTAATSLGPMYVKNLEEAYRTFMGDAYSIMVLLKDFNDVKKDVTYPEVCNELEKTPEVLALLLYTCEILLSDPSRVIRSAKPGENLLYSSFWKLNSVLGDILTAYEGGRTTAQKVKNLAGGLRSKYQWLYQKLFDLYKYRLETVLKVYAAVKCAPQTPGDLDFKKALILYDQDLEDKFDRAKHDFEDYKAHKQGRFKPSTMSRVNTVSVGYVPGRGALSRSANREGYFFRPTNEGNTGGEASNENVRAFYEARDARRRANEQGWGWTQPTASAPPPVSATPPASRRPLPKPLPSTLKRTLTATPALPSIQEERNSNQEGGRKHTKTRKGRKGKQGTRRH